MRYDEFRDQFQDALREAGLFGYIHRPLETIDLINTSRRWEVSFWQPAPQSAAPFHVSARIAFDWDPVNAARAYTCEEDLIMELFGRRQGQRKTEPRWARVDLKLYADLPYGSTTPMPDPQVFGSWTGSIGEKLDEVLTEVKERQQRVVAVLGGRGEVEVETRSNHEGILALKGRVRLGVPARSSAPSLGRSRPAERRKRRYAGTDSPHWPIQGRLGEVDPKCYRTRDLDPLFAPARCEAGRTMVRRRRGRRNGNHPLRR